jgi:hypothetical protein
MCNLNVESLAVPVEVACHEGDQFIPMTIHLSGVDAGEGDGLAAASSASLSQCQQED